MVFVGLGEGHLRDHCEPRRLQHWSQLGCCLCLRETESSPLTAFSCCLPAAFGEGLKRDFHSDAQQLPPFGRGWAGVVSTRNGKDSLLCSCRPTKPFPHSKKGRIPETAAPNCVEAGLILPAALRRVVGFFPPLVIFQC
ncbi:hypothetical protein HJG60_012114 [Phyllostomus discolor]|uniref:Uncharacterized protein n=1 Tax=Phyllostomus discolor TaxID=89673 RepID=A0A833ZMB8_9CHIR|nr:hypothetical protein HJG60_012114 [Phyllostomus discolor]